MANLSLAYKIEEKGKLIQDTIQSQTVPIGEKLTNLHGVKRHFYC